MPSRKHVPGLAALIVVITLLSTGAAGGWAIPIFALAAVGVHIAARLFAGLKHSGDAHVLDVEERMRIIEAELAQARRLDTGSEPRKHVA